jgi:hypothetical protein
MKKSFIAALSFLAITAAQANTADVYLDGNWYLQSGWVENKSPAATIVSFVYSMPTPTPGAGVFETYNSTGTHSPYLVSGDVHYQVETWSGLGINYGERFYFSGLDIDYTEADGVSFNSSTIDTVGFSLDGATVRVDFSDNTSLKYNLSATPWSTSQFFTQTPVQPVPEPATVSLFLCGFAGVLLCSKKSKK